MICGICGEKGYNKATCTLRVFTEGKLQKKEQKKQKKTKNKKVITLRKNYNDEICNFSFFQ